MTPYLHFVSELARLVRQGRQFPLGGFAPPSRPVIAADAPRALIFSPHPDDECIIGGLALRLQREAGLRVVNVAVTQGSNKARQAARWDELTAACDYLGFDLVATVPGGLEHVNVRTRAADPAHWSASVEVIARLLGEHRPATISTSARCTGCASGETARCTSCTMAGGPCPPQSTSATSCRSPRVRTDPTVIARRNSRR